MAQRAAVLRLVHRNLAAFADSDRPLLLGLITDAVRGVSWWAPTIEGGEDVAGIAHWLLDGLRHYGGEDSRSRVLKIITKIPMADAARFETVLRGRVEDGERRDLVAEELQQLIFAGTDGMPAARDLPDVVTSVGAGYLLASEDDIDDDGRYRHSLDISLYFGVKEGLRHDSFPPSAFRGPWVPLLRHHREKALKFLIGVFDHSADWYAHPRLPDQLEQAWEVVLIFADGTTRKQWVNGRLWGLYRAMSVGPAPLESMLMALESWLLEVGKQEPSTLDGILVDILRRSSNAALAAVVASVATAYPHAATEALLVLLSVRVYVVADRSRMVGEGGMTAMVGMLPGARTEDQVYEWERKQAAALPHRKYDLEGAILNLQVGPSAPRVQAILDKHLATLPPKEEQNEDDRVWRLAIHRMDLRQYAVSEPAAPATRDSVTNGGKPSTRYTRLDLKPPEADVQALVDENASRQAAMNSRLSLLMWGVHAFERETGRYDPAQWSVRLAAAQGMPAQAEDGLGTRSAPGFVAAVCVRDHWDDMTQAQRDWCVDTVCSEVLQHADDNDPVGRMHSAPRAADRACAFVLARLLGRSMEPQRTERVKVAFAAAFTHSADEVRSHASWGIDEAIWADHRAIPLRCLNAIATEAASLDEALNAEQTRPRNERRNLREVMAAVTADIRGRFWNDGAFADEAHVTLDGSGRFGTEALRRILVILGRVPQDPVAIAAFLRSSHMLAGSWTSDTKGRGRSNRDHQMESRVSQHIENFLLRTSPDAAREVLAPLLATIEGQSRELSSVMQGLTKVQDRSPNTPQYWLLWELIANAVKNAKWVSRLDTDRYWTGSELLSAVFLTSHWKAGVRHWRFLEGYEHLVPALFDALPATSSVLHDYSRFLYEIGERSLPGAFVRIAFALRRGDARKMLAESNTVFMLDVLLQRYVYGRPLELKRDAPLRDSVLFILDCLVEAGSSAAFRMRDDFVTPTS